LSIVAALGAGCHAGSAERQPTAGLAGPVPSAHAVSDAGEVLTVQAVALDAGSALPEESPRSRGFLGRSDDTLLAKMCRSDITRIERNRGGTTISFRVWLSDGTRGLFKPQQTADVANFRAEL